MTEFLKKIKSRGYWRVIIRPNTFNEQLIGSLNECKRIIQEIQVHIKGYYYPFLSQSDYPTNGIDYIELNSEISFFLEYWRYYQSGMFIQYFGMVEDWQDNADPGLRWQIPERSLSIIPTLRTCTVIYEFASRLANKELLGESCTMSIGLYDTKNRQLVTDHRRHLLGHYICNMDKLPSNDQILRTQDLIANSAELSLEKAVWIFQRFNWDLVSIGVLKEDQEKFLKG